MNFYETKLEAPFINCNGKEENTFDAIVIGSSMTGGWAAKKFCVINSTNSPQK